MVAGPTDLSPQADIVFVIEGTAANGAYFSDIRANYIMPTLDYFGQLKLEERDYPFERTSVQYGLVVYHAADRLPNPNSDCFGPYTNLTKLITSLDHIDLVGGQGESHANIAEGLATALQCFEDLQQRRDNPGPSQKHCILVCNSPPYLLPVTESPLYVNHTAEQLAALLFERGIYLSILSPRKIPALFKLYEKAGGDLSVSQTKHYSKDPRHLVLLNGYSLKEQAVSPSSGGVAGQAPAPNQQQQSQPGSQQQQQQAAQSQQTAAGQAVPGPPGQPGQPPQTGQIPPMSSPSTSVGSPMGSSNAAGPAAVFRANPGNPQGIGAGQQQQQQQGQQPQQQQQAQQQQQSVPQGPPGPPGVSGPQQQMGVPGAPGQRPQHGHVPNMYGQQPPVYQGLPGAPGRAPWRMPQHRNNFMQPGQNFAGAGNAQPGPNQSSALIAQLTQPPGVSQAQHTAPFAAGQQTMRVLMRNGQPVTTAPGGPQPGQQQQTQQQPQHQLQQQQPQQSQQPPIQNPQVGPSLDRQPIWSGLLEWSESRSKSPEMTRQTRTVYCQVTSNAKDGEQDVNADNWPPKLAMQLVPKALIGTIGGVYLKHSKSVQFHPQPGENLDALSKMMVSGYAGCVHFAGSTTSSDLRVLLLLFAAEKRGYLGFIPMDQPAFVDRLRKVIQSSKKATNPNRALQPGPGNVAPLQQSGAGGAQPMMMGQANPMAMVGGPMAQNVVAAGASAAQGGPVGPGGPGGPGTPQQMVLGQQTLGQQGLGQQALSQQALGQQALSQQALGQQALGQQGLGQLALGQQALGQQALGQQALGQQGLGQQALGQQALGQQAQAGPIGVPMGSAGPMGTAGPMGGPGPMGLAGMDGQMARPQGPVGPAGPNQAGPGGPGMAQGIMRPGIDSSMVGIEAARKQNLSKIEHLHQSLQAAQFKEQQYKSLELQQQMHQQRMSQQPGPAPNPGQQRLMRPASNPGLRLLLQQQPQYRTPMQQHMQQQQQQQQQQQLMRGPAQGGMQQQFDDPNPFEY